MSFGPHICLVLQTVSRGRYPRNHDAIRSQPSWLNALCSSGSWTDLFHEPLPGIFPTVKVVDRIADLHGEDRYIEMADG